MKLLCLVHLDTALPDASFSVKVSAHFLSFLTRRLRDLICVLSTTLSRLPLVRQDVRRRQKGEEFFSGTPLITCPPDRVPGKGRGPLHSQKVSKREHLDPGEASVPTHFPNSLDPAHARQEVYLVAGCRVRCARGLALTHQNWDNRDIHRIAQLLRDKLAELLEA